MVDRALFTVGVFAFITKSVRGRLFFLVNIRSDQKKQRQRARLPVNWLGKIVDLPGGGVKDNENLEQALVREVREETACGVKIIGSCLGPFVLIKKRERIRDLAFVYPVRLQGRLRSTKEADGHLWVTFQNFEEGRVRFPGKKKGGRGRMWSMARRGVKGVS